MLRCIDPPSGTVTWLWASSTTKADSHADMSGAAIIQSIRQTSGMRLDVTRWVVSGGEWQVVLSMSQAMQATWLDALRRGLLFQILAGPHTFTEAQMEPIASCVLYGVQVDGVRVTLTLRSALTAMGSRLTTSPATSDLFYDIEDPSTRSQTTVSTAWTVGAGDLEVASTAGFDEDTANSGVRLLLCDPGGTPGGPISGSAFYLRVNGTGTSPTRFTSPDTTDLFGTTRVALSSGDPVYEVPYSFGHPVELAMRFATSTGSAVNGTRDTLTAGAWGLRMPLGFFDAANTTGAGSDAVVSSGSYRLDVFATEPVQDPLSWMQGWMGNHGIFWTMRHGLLTCRAPFKPGFSSYPSGVHITDADIKRLSYQSFDPSRLPTRKHTITSGDGTVVSTGTVTTVGALPITSEVQTSLGYTWDNESAIGTSITSRTSTYRNQVGELFTLSCSSWRLAQLCPGDEVTLTTDYHIARPYSGSTSINSRPCLVLGVATQWSGGEATVSLTLLAFPDP